MRAIIVTVVLLLAHVQWSVAQNQPLLKIGSESVSKEEFLKAFLKNNVDGSRSETAIRDYLELFIRFKLKVKAAYQARLDTLPAQKAEYAEFRSQLTDSYLVDENTFRQLVNEAFERSQKDIHLAHIFIPFSSAPGRPGDTSFAAKQADVAFQLLNRGNDFGKTAAEFSADTVSRKQNGDIGFITVFTLPYLFENVAYTTPVGQYSRPFKSSIGYHIFKNLGERKALGTISVAQILFAFMPDMNGTARAEIEKRADSVYNALQNRAPFAEMVAKYSNDNTSLNVHGELKPFKPGTFDPAFENQAFSLVRDGELSKPFATQYGYHIIKRLAHFPVNVDITADSAMTALKEEVRQNERMEVSRKAFLKHVYTVIGFKEAGFSKQALFALSDSALQSKKYGSTGTLNNSSPLFSLGTEKKFVKDWVKYLLDVRNVSSLSMGKTVPELYQQFKDLSVTEYYRNHLEKYNQEYAAQIKEFKEGNLLFEMMQKMVWDKASADSAGQKAFYTSHKLNYTWKPSADAIIFNAVDSASAYELRKMVVSNPGKWRNAMISFMDKAQADSGRYELEQFPGDSMVASSIAAGSFSEPIKNQAGSGVYSFFYLVKRHAGKSLKSLEEARGAMLNDYQQFLEDKWIGELKRKYPVSVNQAVLQTLWKR